MKVRENSIGASILKYLHAAEELAMVITSNPHQWVRWAEHGRHPAASYRTVVFRLLESGLIEIEKDDNKKIFKLTPAGKMEVLMLKAKMPRPGKWDGKWRMVFFDIPEDSSAERTQLRRLLLKNDFKKMQASVYISPWPLNREAISYLKQTGLIRYIRFGRLDELDEDGDLKKRFHLVK
jgi:phenylacetic acid degradation operon negative regulatory protein